MSLDFLIVAMRKSIAGFLKTEHKKIPFDLYPHCKTMKQKLYFMGLMVNKLLQTKFEWRKTDDRDSYINKRIDTPGMLMANLFRQCYGKITKELKTMIEKDINQLMMQTYNMLTQYSDEYDYAFRMLLFYIT